MAGRACATSVLSRILELELGLLSIRRRRRLLLRADILEEDAAAREVTLDQAAAVVRRCCAVHGRSIRTTAARVVSAMGLLSRSRGHQRV
jgi:hypothetical protein